MAHDHPPRPRALFIAYFFPPSAGATVQRTARTAKYLRDFGYEPIVLAPEPRAFEEDPLSFGTDPSFLAELPSDLKIYRVRPFQVFGLLRLLKKLKILWAHNFVIRPDEKLTWSLAAIVKGLRVARVEKIDLICVSVGPWSSSSVGYVLKTLLRKPLIYDCNDPWTQWAMGVWPTWLHFKLERFLERRVLRKADGIAVLGERYRDDLLAIHPRLDPARIVPIENGYDTASLPPLDELRARRRDDCNLVIVHAGKFYDTWGSAQRTAMSSVLKRAYDATLGRLRYEPRPIDNSVAGPRTLLHALARIRDEQPDAARRIRLELIGRTHPNVAALVGELGLQDIVRLTGHMPHDACLKRMFDADVLFLPFARYSDGSPVTWLPLKLYEYMLVGKPVLAAVPEGSVKTALARARIGFWTSPDDPNKMAATVMELFRAHQSGGIPVQPDWDYIKRFDRRALTGQLAALMDRVLAGRKPLRTMEVNK